MVRPSPPPARDTSEAEDVVQETFLPVLRHENKLAELQDARSWLVRVTWIWRWTASGGRKGGTRLMILKRSRES
jgi:hypothetical protein